MPLIVTVFEVSTADSATLPWLVKTNTLGTVSQVGVVTLKLRGIPAMVTVTVVVVLHSAEAVWLSVTDWPLLMVPAIVVNIPASIL